MSGDNPFLAHVKAALKPNDGEGLSECAARRMKELAARTAERDANCRDMNDAIRGRDRAEQEMREAKADAYNAVAEKVRSERATPPQHVAVASSRLGAPLGVIEATYKNHKGETAKRRIIPLYAFWGCTKWHPQNQWMLHAYCLDRQDERTFAMNNFVISD